MDLLSLIRSRISALPDGPHLRGLQSVLRHIEAAYRHLARVQTENDDTACTDAIYRTNQAFEGSVKEAYRVLANKDPEYVRPFDIEQYLEENETFRGRVLKLFTNYRTDWRNPSTHDYTLDFNEDEAFLAIVSVSAFTKLLVDQIAEKLTFEAVQRDTHIRERVVQPGDAAFESFVDRVTRLFLEFSKHYVENSQAIPIESEAQLMGALSGFLSSVAPDLQAITGRVYRTSQTHYVDMTIANGQELIVIEVKRGSHRALLEQGLHQLRLYIEAAKAQNGILFLYSGKVTEYASDPDALPSHDPRIRVIRPKAS
jgi:hypothetical protein